MSPVLQNLVTQASSIQQLGYDQARRLAAFLMSSMGNSIYGQTPVTAQPSALNPVNAQAISAAFQGFNEEQYLDVLTLTIINTAIRLNSPTGGITAAQLSTNGFTVNALVNANWGGAPGIFDSEQVINLLRYGTLIQAGANLNGITNPF
jgi:hypothetical protein